MNESTVWLNLNEELNPVKFREEILEDQGEGFKIEELKFVKPKAFGTEKYVHEFPEELLEKVMSDE